MCTPRTSTPPPVLATRGDAGTTHATTVATTSARVYFQVLPGSGAGHADIGSAGIEWEICIDGVQHEHGTTGSDGATTDFQVPPGAEVILHALGTDYFIQASPAIASSYSIAGLTQRLQMLGYAQTARYSTLTVNDEWGLYSLESDERRHLAPMSDYTVVDGHTRAVITSLVAAAASDSSADANRLRRVTAPSAPTGTVGLPIFGGTRRFCPVHFRTASQTFQLDGQPPDPARPVLDERGSFGRGAVLHPGGGVTWYDVRGESVVVPGGRSITVRLVRQLIAHDAPLFVKIDFGTRTIGARLAGGAMSARVPAGDTADITITGEDHTTSYGELQVRYGSDSGPLLHAMTLNVYPRIRLPIQPYRVVIQAPGGPSADTMMLPYEGIFDVARRVWAQYGIDLDIRPVVTINESFAVTNEISTDSELLALFGRHSTPGVVPVYFAYGPGSSAMHDARGLGISPATREALVLYYGAAHGTMPPPLDTLPMGVLVLYRDPEAVRDPNDANSWGIDMAHEIGHILALLHDTYAGGRPPLWTLRMLMCPVSPFPDPTDHYTEVGSGLSNRGTLVGLRTIGTSTYPPEVTIARAVAEHLAGQAAGAR